MLVFPHIAAWMLSCGTPPEATPTPEPTPHAEAGYAGSKACRSCHEDEASAWAQSTHALAERPVTAVTDAFDDPNHPAIALASGASPKDRPVSRVIGIDPLWQPLVPAPNGRLQVSSRAFDPAAKAWFDVFDDPRAPGDWGHWTGRGMTWNSQCAACHNTAVERGWDPSTDTYDTTMAEMGVGCEACHGPSAPHAASPTVPTPSPKGRDPVADTCASCHIRWTPTADPFVPGDALLDRGIPVLPAVGPGYAANGAVVAESFEAMAFRSSRMHAAGVRCVDCHDPHSNGLPAEPADTCQTCHAGLPDHDHHGNGPGAPNCIDCHMPVTTYMQRDPRHDHGFRVPDPTADAAIDQPGACARCHDDDVREAADRWWPVPRDRARTLAIHRALSGEDVREPLDAAYAREAHPLWRAILLTLRPHATDDLAEAASSDDPWVRRAAAMASPPQAPWMRGLLHDRVPAVALEAAATMQPVLDPTHADGAPFRAHLEHLGDHAAAVITLGAWFAGHGHLDDAEEAFARAVSLDPASPDAWRQLAITQSARGDAPAAYDTLTSAIARLPHEPELAFLRALAAGPLGHDPVPDLKRTLAVDPEHGRAAYNLGLALHASSQPEASPWLEKAHDLRPEDPAPAYALATITYADGDLESTARWVDQALARDPTYAPALALKRRLATP